VAPDRPVAGLRGGRAGDVGGSVLPRARGLSLPPRGPDHGGGGDGADGDALQLLRDGDDPGLDGRDLRGAQGSGVDDAAGRRDRLRLLDNPAQGRGRIRRRGGRLRPPELHGRLGRHVPHDHVGGLAAGRDDGDDALRPPRHRGLHHREIRPGAAQELQRLGPRDGRLHGGREGRWAVGTGVRRQGLSDAARAGPVEPHHAVDLRLCRTGRDLHRPHQRDEQPRLCRDDRGDEPLRRAAPAALWRVSSRLHQPRAARDRPVRGGRGAGRSGARRSRRSGRADDGQRGRRLALPPARAGGGGAEQAAHRAWRHGAGGRAPDDGAAVWLRGGGDRRRRPGCAGSRGRPTSPRS
jgi:hypothetical protein